MRLVLDGLTVAEVAQTTGALEANCRASHARGPIEVERDSPKRRLKSQSRRGDTRRQKRAAVPHCPGGLDFPTDSPTPISTTWTQGALVDERRIDCQLDRHPQVPCFGDLIAGQGSGTSDASSRTKERSIVEAEMSLGVRR